MLPQTLAFGSEFIKPYLYRIRMPMQDNEPLWEMIGFCGILTFGSRFLLQWLHSERRKESHVPIIFWWQSVIGSVLCLAYAIQQRQPVFMAGYIFNLIPYTRNIILMRRKAKQEEGS